MEENTREKYWKMINVCVCVVSLRMWQNDTRISIRGVRLYERSYLVLFYRFFFSDFKNNTVFVAPMERSFNYFQSSMVFKASVFEETNV